MPKLWWADALATLAAMLIIGAPALFTQNGFEYDFTNHLWLVWLQEQSLYHHHAATYFMNSPAAGIFYPFFLFYGGTLYVITGLIAAVLGQRVTLAYIGVILLGVAASYAGLVWLCRQLGVRSWLAHAPAITYVASAYFVTNLYGRGAWPEFMATSVIPLLLASGWNLTHSRRFGLLPGVLFVVSAVVFTGSHNITLLLGAIASIGTVLLVGWAMRGGPFPPLRRMVATGALFVAAVLVNSWFLLPDLFYQSRTAIAHGALIPWSATAEFNTFGVFFDPLRGVPKHSGTPALYLQLPDWFLAWVIGVTVATWASMSQRLKRVSGALLVLFVLTLAFILVQPLWNSLPRTLQEVQFPYRLSTYAVLFVSGLVIVATLSLQRCPAPLRRQILSLSLVGVIAISLGACLWQLWVPNTRDVYSYSARHQIFVSPHIPPRTWYDSGNYHDVWAPIVPEVRSRFTIDPATINSSEVHLTLDAPPGMTPFGTNIGAGPYIVEVTGGAAIYGVEPTGYEVLQRTGSGRGPIHVTIKPAGGFLTIGKVLTELALVGLLLAFIAASATKVRRRVLLTRTVSANA